MQQLGYLDAGTGSMLVSALVAGAAGAGVLFRLGWRRIVGFFSSKQRAEHGGADHDPPVSASSGASAEPRA